MKAKISYNPSDSNFDFDKVIEKLQLSLKTHKDDLGKLEKELNPLKLIGEELNRKIQRIESLVDASVSLSVIKSTDKGMGSSKGLDTHMRGRVRFVIDGETINIPVYIGILKDLIEQSNGLEVNSREWSLYIRKISLEKSFKRLYALKPEIFDDYMK